ncbi:SelT-like protein [Diplonema papillatum]|nr:SelT-like protein [Diplonema papillatum]
MKRLLLLAAAAFAVACGASSRYLTAKEMKAVLAMRGIDADAEGLNDDETLLRTLEATVGAKLKGSPEEELQVKHTPVTDKPATKAGKKASAVTGHKKLFDDYARHLHKRFPRLAIEGEAHLPAVPVQVFANVLQLAFYAGLAMSIFGWHTLLPEPASTFVAQNKGQTMAILFFVNIISAQMLATGAFEVILNEDLIYSKIKTGQPPRLDALVELITQHFAAIGSV